ncbi:ATP-grasp peptide maturase system methyltransferase [Streptomyces sp. NPDC005955]|uniref:ATP-grasp peptide maturase system methyltransferase n=1 Tax=Streptomyces sp. NPDC005955 TaxID=3364738 RepID=UPI0036AC1574
MTREHADAVSPPRSLVEVVGERLAGVGEDWLPAVDAVPRELFLGDAVFRRDGTGWAPVRRADVGEDAWLRMARADTTWVTQVDGIGAEAAQGPVSGAPTSSSTLPSVVVRTLAAAGLRGRERVLEVGTGTGYSTAVLCHRLGDERVTSIEYDPRVAASAARHLAAAGAGPTLVVGDGLDGYEDGAGADGYDAVVATCAVRSVPPAWLWQLADGGSLTFTLSGWMFGAGLIRLALDEDGTAHGRFTGDEITYMLARPHDRPPRPSLHRHEGEVRPTRIDPALLDDWTALFVAQLAAPSAELLHLGAEPVLVDVATGSQAWTELRDGVRVVHQDGPLRLWDQVEHGIAAWIDAGSPGQRDFGMTVTDSVQTVWLGAPDGPSWRLPA